MKIVIINYGAGNIQSIKVAFKRFGIEAILTDDEKVFTNSGKPQIICSPYGTGN